MNKFNLLYRRFTPHESLTGNSQLESMQNEITLENINGVYKQLRHFIKPYFVDTKISYENINGLGAQRFNSRISRFKSDWLEFKLPDYIISPSDYPTDDVIYDQGLLQDTALADIAYWENSIREEIEKQSIFLLVGLEYMPGEKDKAPRMRLGGLPADIWPCRFKLFEFIITNAPICNFIQNRPSILL